ncbi:MAG: host attachment protein [Pseudomonadales bacterium]
MGDIWVVVADSVRARFFRLDDQQHLEELDDLVAPEDRLKDQSLNANRGGRAFDSVGGGRHAMEKHETPHEHAVKAFAGRIVERLEQARTGNLLEKLVVIAPPRMLGYLREHFSDALEDRVACSIHKELTRETPARIADYLPRTL